MRTSVLIGTRNRAEALRRCLASLRAQTTPPAEVIVLDDASEAADVADVVRTSGLPGSRTIRTERRHGVAAGRNLLMREATGDLFFVLDDDAWLPDAQTFERLHGFCARHGDAAIVATRIVDHRGGRTAMLAPFPASSIRRHPELLFEAQRVSYFLGGAHVVRRGAYDRVGGYDEGFVFGEEELELSYRLLQAGMEIWYAPDMEVHHESMPSVLRTGANRASEALYHTRNRVVIAKRFLPIRYWPSYLGVWLARNALAAAKAGQAGDFLRGVAAGVNDARAALRTRLSPDALAYLRKHHGRLWF